MREWVTFPLLTLPHYALEMPVISFSTQKDAQLPLAYSSGKRSAGAATAAAAAAASSDSCLKL